jgi:CPA1 family monovalent cation:H+ antiporter
VELTVPAVIVLGALAIIAVTSLAPRIGVSAPLILVVAGVAVSFLPFVRAVELEPDIILVGVLPPLLYSSAVSMPVMDFRRDFKVIGGLSVALVAITSVVVGFLLYALVPSLTLPVAIALAAIVSPTDAVATTIVRKLGVSPRIVTILEGESLLNDASALVILRSAMAAFAASVSLLHVAGDFVYAVVVAVGIGLVVGRGSLLLRSRLRDPVLNTAASFAVPFIAYVPAEELGASGLVAVVVTGLIAGQGAAKYLTPQDRRAEESNWRTVEVLLEGGVFLLMGLELYGLVEEVHAEHTSTVLALGIAGLAFAGVLVVRSLFLFFMLYGLRRDRQDMTDQRARLEQAQQRLDGGFTGFTGSGGGPPVKQGWRTRRRVRREKARRRRAGEVGPLDDAQIEARRNRVQTFIDKRVADIDYLTGEPLGPKQGTVLVWAGMRGVVTLAAAQSLPATAPSQPGYHRALIVLAAFGVAAGSLLLQGGSLPWLVRHLGLGGADAGEARAERRQLVAELASAAAAECDRDDLTRPDGSPYEPRAVSLVRDASVRLVDEQGFDVVPGTESTGYDEYRELRIRVLQAQRDELLRLRDVGSYSSDALSGALEVLDADEIGLALRGGDDDV